MNAWMRHTMRLSPECVRPAIGLALAIAGTLGGTADATAPGISEVDKAFSEEIAARVGAPIFTLVPAGGLMVFTRLDGRCGAMSLRMVADAKRIATVNGRPFPADGFVLYTRPESAHFNPATNSCDIPNPDYTASSLDLSPGPTAGATQLANGHLRVVISATRSEGGCAYTDQLGISSCCTPAPGAVDLNGDGDFFDSVVQELALDVDPRSRDVTVPPAFVNTAMQADGASLSTDGTTIASFVEESTIHASCDKGPGCSPPQMHCPGDGLPGQDLDGDGKAMSRVLRLYDVDTRAARNTGLGQLTPNCPPAPTNFAVVNEFSPAVQRVQIGGGIVAFESDEFPPQPGGTFCFPGTSCVSCAGFPGRDYDGDGRYTSRVARYFEVGDPRQVVHVGPVVGTNSPAAGGSMIGLIGTDGTSIAYALQESGPFEFCAPCHDLTADCDQSDQALQIYDIATKSVTNTGAAVVRGPMLGNFGQHFIDFGLVAFLTTEAEMGPPPSCSGVPPANGRDLNGDGDTLDTILRLFDVRQKTIINTNVAVIDESPRGGPPPPASMVGTDGTLAALARDFAGPAATVRYIADRCAGPTPVTCTARDQCHVPGSCDPPTGLCSDPPAPSGTACEDRDPCTGPDACDGAGGCKSGPLVLIGKPGDVPAALDCIRAKLP